MSNIRSTDLELILYFIKGSSSDVKTLKYNSSLTKAINTSASFQCLPMKHDSFFGNQSLPSQAYLFLKRKILLNR